MGTPMVVTDLDGTLFQPHGRLSPVDRDTLLALGAGGTRRVAATGRSLFSARKVMGAEFPIDYLVFSSGAGVLAWPSQSLLRSRSLSDADVETAARALLEAGLDFMVHRPIPDNHHFRYYAASGRENPDFRRRCEIYSEFARAGDPQAPVFEEACQLLAVDTDPRSGRYEALRRRLAHLQVIRATSPLDGRSVWIEIFPRSVSKALGAAWLAEREGIDPREVLAVGNDYNDLDLLQWAGSSFVVANAPADLRERFRTVPSNEENGFSRAVELWRGEREAGRPGRRP